MITTSKIEKIRGRITVPGDKSISHRAVMLLAISRGSGRITGFLRGADCLNTIQCFRHLGVAIEDSGNDVVVQGRGLGGLRKPAGVLDVGNSGTTMRLICGILAGQSFASTITGDQSVQGRPMDRIVLPLRDMGAVICGTEPTTPPLKIVGGRLKAIDYTLPVPSAQIKSAILLAGLYAEGKTIVREQIPARNHTELMLASLGASLRKIDDGVSIVGSELEARDIQVPGDISSAAFFIAAAAALPGSHLVVRNVGLNPTRTGLLDVLLDMGASLELENIVHIGGEPQGDIVVRGRRLQGTSIIGEMMPRVVDEIPILTVVASVAEGTTTITGAEELRVKESNRLGVLVSELSKLGIRIRELPDGLEIEGPNQLSGAQVDSHGDHRIAMALAVAGLFAREPVHILGSECINVSFPGFEQVLRSVST